MTYTAVGPEPTAARSGSPVADLELDNMNRIRVSCGVSETAFLGPP